MMLEPMTAALVMFGGITVIVGVVVLSDWYSRRKDRHSA